MWTSRKALGASAKLHEKISDKRSSAEGTEIDLTGDEGTDSALASPSAAKKLKDVKQYLQHLEKRSVIEDIWMYHL